MTEAEARTALRAYVAVGEIERWIAEQRWEAVAGGWRVRERFQGWHLRVEPVAGALRVVMSAGPSARATLGFTARIVGPATQAPAADIRSYPADRGGGRLLAVGGGAAGVGCGTLNRRLEDAEGAWDGCGPEAKGRRRT